MQNLSYFISDVPCDDTKDTVIYWMQAAQRTRDNLALNKAIELANHYEKPLTVLFVVNPEFKEANQRHIKFMLEGLDDVAKALYEASITFKVLKGNPAEVLKPYLKTAVCLISEQVYLKPVQAMKQAVYQVAKDLKVCTLRVTTNLIVPPNAVTDKLEYAARTIRKKLLKRVDDYMVDLTMPALNHQAAKVRLESIDHEALLALFPSEDVPVSTRFKGGQSAAYDQFEQFLERSLPDYDQSADPSTDLTSKLSPYLHFGHISPLVMYQRVQWLLDANQVKASAAEGFLEQLLIRRELAHNFTVFFDGYDAFDHMAPGWAYETMAAHEDDTRDYLYDAQDYMACRTHDDYFNAAMAEMVNTGYMHNYMRMYWAKKIIEWSKSYQEAYDTILTLNNRYFLDGRDSVSYASVAWCFGRHDQAWKERPIFGKLRYMNANGLKRKFNIEAYVNTWLKKWSEAR